MGAAAESAAAAADPRSTFSAVAALHLDYLEHIVEREPSTLQDYRSILHAHLAPFFDGKPIDRVTPEDVARYVKTKRTRPTRKTGRPLRTNTVVNHLTFAHAVFERAVKMGLARRNPVAVSERPRQPRTDPDIRFLTVEELRTVIRSVPDDALGPTDRVLVSRRCHDRDAPGRAPRPALARRRLAAPAPPRRQGGQAEPLHRRAEVGLASDRADQ